MRRLLVYEHIGHEHAGAFLSVARKTDLPYDVVRLGNDQTWPDFSRYSHLLVMGGPQSVYDTADQYPTKDFEIETIRRFTEDGKPVLGVCLGSQLVAHAFGGKVYPNVVGGMRRKETGFYPIRLTENGLRDPLFNGLPADFTVFQWHGDVFDLPPEATRLLAKGNQVTNQAFVVGNPDGTSTKTYGLLFHLEVTPDMVAQLALVDNEWFHKDNDGVDEAVIQAQAGSHERTIRELGARLFRNWKEL